MNLSSIGKGEYQMDLTVKEGGCIYPTVLQRDQEENLKKLSFALPSSLVTCDSDAPLCNTIKKLDSNFIEKQKEYVGNLEDAKQKDIREIKRLNSEGGWATGRNIALGAVVSVIVFVAINIFYYLFVILTDRKGIKPSLGSESFAPPVVVTPNPLSLVEKYPEFGRLQESINAITFQPIHNQLQPYLDQIAKAIENGISYEKPLDKLQKTLHNYTFNRSMVPIPGIANAFLIARLFPTQNLLTVVPALAAPNPVAAMPPLDTPVPKPTLNISSGTGATVLVGTLAGATIGIEHLKNDNNKLVTLNRTQYLVGNFYDSEIERQNQAIATIFERCCTLFPQIVKRSNLIYSSPEITELSQLCSLYDVLDRIHNLVKTSQNTIVKKIKEEAQPEETLKGYLKTKYG